MISESWKRGIKNSNIHETARAPVNRVAARVVMGGEHYHPNCRVQVAEFIAPPPMVPKYQHPTAPNFVDLTGMKKGRLTVLGLMKGEKGKWVVRCVCGTYTTRTAKSIKSVKNNPRAHLDACRECMHLAYRKREDLFRRTGRDVDLEEVW